MSFISDWCNICFFDFVKVYPYSWTAIYIALDNVGMWNLRTEFWARQYLGQQFYLRVYTASTSIRDEFPIPKNARLCGRASGRHTRPLWASKGLKNPFHSYEGILALESWWKVVNLSTCNFIVECFEYICCAPVESRRFSSLNDLNSRSHSFPAKKEEYYLCSLCIII